MKKEPRIFTLEEAGALLPEVQTRLLRLMKHKEEYARRHDELLMFELLTQAEHQAGFATDPEGLEREIKTLEASLEDIEKDLRAFRELGCVLRNLDQGQVDFLGKRGDEYVYYCWKAGERSISFYHSLKGGMDDRKPI